MLLTCELQTYYAWGKVPEYLLSHKLLKYKLLLSEVKIETCKSFTFKKALFTGFLLRIALNKII